MKTRIRRLSTVVSATGIAATLGACSPDSSPEGQARSAAQAFLDELAAGNHTAAINLTTSSRDDFACLSLTDDTSRGAITNPDVESVSVDGDTATVEANYFGVPDGDMQQTFTLERADDAWLVVLPDSYRIALEFDAPTIADAEIRRITGDADTPDGCQITVSDGAAQTLALPGGYIVAIADRTGVFTPDRHKSAWVGSEFAPIEVSGVHEGNVYYLSTHVSLDLRNMFVQCIYNDFAPDTTCPDGTEGTTFAGDPLAFHEEFVGSDAFALDRVWTEDERTWLFTTEPTAIAVVRDGEEVSLDVMYSGRLATDAAGDLEIVLD